MLGLWNRGYRQREIGIRKDPDISLAFTAVSVSLPKNSLVS